MRRARDRRAPRACGGQRAARDRRRPAQLGRPSSSVSEATSRATSMGLTMCARAPAARLFSRSSSPPNPLTTITARGLSASDATSSTPLPSGSDTSVTRASTALGGEQRAPFLARARHEHAEAAAAERHAEQRRRVVVVVEHQHLRQLRAHQALALRSAAFSGHSRVIRVRADAIGPRLAAVRLEHAVDHPDGQPAVGERIRVRRARPRRASPPRP